MKWFRISAWIGVVVVAVSLVLTLTGAQVDSLPAGYVTPIIAFEFAETSAEIRHIFGAAGSSAEMERIAAFTRTNQLDYLYMLLYAGFLATFGLGVAQRGNRMGFVVVGLAVVALFTDAIENMTMGAIMAQLGVADLARELAFELQRLKLVTWLKWGSLALAFVALIPFLAKGGRLGRFISAVAGLPFVLGVFSYFMPGGLRELFALSIALLFLLLILFSWLERES